MANFDMGSARDLAQSDTANDKFNWLMVVTTAGSVDYDQEGGNNIVLTSVPTGVWIPVGKATNVNTASTAAGLIVV